MDPSENDCDELEIGNFYFLNVNAWPTRIDAEGNYLAPGTKRHGEVAFFGWQDIPPGLDLYLTDRAWSEHDESFVPNTVYGDGIVGVTSPADRGFPAGLAFGMGNNTLLRDNHGMNWTDVDVNSTDVNTSQYFQLGSDGDQIFFYCKSGDGRDRPLAAFSYNGPFLANLTDGADHDYGTNTSAAPLDFYRNAWVNSTIPTPGMLVMSAPSGRRGGGETVCRNWEFVCPGGVDARCKMGYHDLRIAMQDAGSNWYGKNPDGTVCLPSAVGMLSPFGGAWLWAPQLLLLLWLLVTV
mmetsp:Transcript_26344/g.61901  ORF Transcript_26344/g.61901 Transcript_26344/m.61901 type:complete len:294 (-) Transcript_26344:491-1372(-)